VYGALSQFHSSGPTVTVRDKAVSPAWAAVRECTFADLGSAERSTAGEHADLTLQAGDQPVSRLVGRVTAWGETSVEIDHPRLGALTIPAKLVTEVRPLFHGHRQVIDSKPRHLGTRDTSGFRVVKADGVVVRFPVECGDASPTADVVIDARAGRSPGVLAVTVNGEVAGKVTVAGDDFAPYRVALPAGVKRGRNELEIRWAASPKAGDAEIRGVRVEVPRK